MPAIQINIHHKFLKVSHLREIESKLFCPFFSYHSSSMLLLKAMYIFYNKKRIEKGIHFILPFLCIFFFCFSLKIYRFLFFFFVNGCLGTHTRKYEGKLTKLKEKNHVLENDFSH